MACSPRQTERIEHLIEAFTEGVGPNVQIALDLNYNFRPQGVIKIGRRLERFNMQWLEYDAWDPEVLLEVNPPFRSRWPPVRAW